MERSYTWRTEDLKSLTMDREVLHFRDSLIPRFADLIYNGYWFSPERT